MTEISQEIGDGFAETSIYLWAFQTAIGVPETRRNVSASEQQP